MSTKLWILAALPVAAAIVTGVAPANPAAPAQSGGERWAPSHGPEGGPAFTLAVAPSAPKTVYVGTGRGVFRSTNRGRSWKSAGLAERREGIARVTSLAVDPRTPTTVYAGLDRVFKSTNGGRTWRALALRGQPVAISPTGPPTVYAAAAGVGEKSRLFRSTDGGRSWRPADRGLPSTYHWALAFDPTAPTTVYAAMGRRGVVKSSDGGASWHALRISLTYGRVTAIAVDPQHPLTVYAGTDAGVIKSLDGGRSWQVVNAAIRRHGRDRSYMQVSALVVDTRDPQTVYATTRCAGVFKSTDGGRRWSPANAGLEPQCSRAYSLALDPEAPQTLYAADPDRGVFKSIDGGARWRVANTGLLSLSYLVSSLAVDPQRPRTVYASAGALGLFKSSDGGGHWRSLASGLDRVEQVALDPSNPMNILVGGSTHGVVRIVRSTDAGRTWAEAGLGASVPGEAVVAVSGETAYAGSTYGFGLFGSIDGGRRWRRVGPRGAVYVYAIAIAPEDAAVVYAGVSCCGAARGLFKSTDSGRSWQRLTGAPHYGPIVAIALDPLNPETVYVSTGVVFKSTDGGTSWQRANSRVGPTAFVTALAIDPVHPTTLYAATGRSGVFRSRDAGKSWRSLNAGLAALYVKALALDATGQTLYAGTAGGGVVSLRRNPRSLNNTHEVYSAHFAGFPPVGVKASTRTTGRLVLSLRPTAVTEWNVYADGRIIWQKWTRSGDATVVPKGARRLDTGYVQQRLTLRGVQLLRSKILATGVFEHNLRLELGRHAAWVFHQVRRGDRMVTVEGVSSPDPSWNEHFTKATPAQVRALAWIAAFVAYPARWLPTSAWADRQIRAFVPSHYMIAVDRSYPDISKLPPPAGKVLF